MAYIDKTFTNIAVGSTDSATKAIYITNIKLGDCDDAATAILGNLWRIPTKEECLELINNCTYVKDTVNSIEGIRLTSKTTNNSIFIPAGGFIEDEELILDYDLFALWTSTLGESAPACACYFYCDEAYNSTLNIAVYNPGINRYIGVNIRPVSKTNGVDMGVSVKWAAYNLSPTGFVSSIENTGGYFAWGEITTKNVYSLDTYRYVDEHGFTKYNHTDNKVCLEGLTDIKKVYQGTTLLFSKDIQMKTDDVARKLLGGKWRIPTKAEWDDLLKVVTVTKSGTNALMTFSDGQTLTFPAGAYWASTWVNDNGFVWAYSGVKSDGSTLNNAMQGNNRQNGNQIRAVVSLSEATEEDKANGVIVGNVVWSKTNLVEPETGNKYTRWGDPDKWFATTNDAKKETYKWYDYTLKVYTKYTSNDGLKELQLEYF